MDTDKYFIVDQNTEDFFITNCPFFVSFLEIAEDIKLHGQRIIFHSNNEFFISHNLTWCAKNRFGKWKDFENLDLTVSVIFKSLQDENEYYKRKD